MSSESSNLNLVEAVLSSDVAESKTEEANPYKLTEPHIDQNSRTTSHLNTVSLLPIDETNDNLTHQGSSTGLIVHGVPKLDRSETPKVSVVLRHLFQRPDTVPKGSHNSEVSQSEA